MIDYKYYFKRKHSACLVCAAKITDDEIVLMLSWDADNDDDGGEWRLLAANLW